MNARTALAGVLLVGGTAWSLAFPKKASFDHDLVASVCLGLGLIGSGALLLAWHRMRRATAVLGVLLLWSVLGNAYLLAWGDDAADVLLSLTPAVRGDSGSSQPPDIEPRSHLHPAEPPGR
jgi:hypothetical protein